MALTQFDKSTVRQIVDDCEAALQTVAEKYGITLSRKNCSYYPNEMPVPFKLTITQTDTTGNEIDPMAQDFITHCHSFGLTPEDLGREFSQFGGNTFKICGIKPKSYKYPIIAEKVGTNKRFKFGAMEVKCYLEMAS